MTAKKQVDPGKADLKSSALTTGNKDSKQVCASRDNTITLQRAIGNSAVGQLLSSDASKANPASDRPIEKKANENLPKVLQSNIEASFGQDFSDVDIQKNSQKALELNALAFTQGENIHFAPGQFNPASETGRNLIGHEFTHIAQQRSGVVKPTRVMAKGLAVNENKGLESEADQMGKKAARGESLAKYQSPGLGIRNYLRPLQAKSNVIQRALTTWGGTWDADQYDLRKDKDPYGTVYPAATGARGVDMKLKFTPGKNADAKLIGLTQSVNSLINKKPSYINKTIEGRSIKSKDAIKVNSVTKETDEGTHIDRTSSINNPIYGSPNIATGKTIEDTPIDNNATGKSTKVGNPHLAGGANATYQLGYRYKTGKTWKKQSAMLFDGPTLSGVAKNSKQIFETTALAIKGTQANTYYGSVRWGWQTDAKSKFTKIPFQVVSQGVPSSTFMKAAEKWNTTKTSTGKNTVDLPIRDVKLISNISGVNIGPGPVFVHLAFWTRVVVLPGFPSVTESYIRVVDGPHTGETGRVQNSDLSDERP